jgi:exonuclease VII large subunit
VTKPATIDSYFVEHLLNKDWASSQKSLPNSYEQLQLDLGESLTPRPPLSRPKPSPAAPLRTQKHEALVSDLVQAQAIIHNQIERIQHLEQALDQSLACAAEMRLQLVHQQFLENQLASTEEIANIQQQAIAQLKKQLAHQKQSLDTQHQELQTQRHSFQALLSALEALTQGYLTDATLKPTSLDLDKYAKYIDGHPPTTPTQDPLNPTFTNLEDSSSLPEFTSVTLEQTNAILHHLQQTFSDRDASIQQLETELHRAHIALQEQQALINNLQQSNSAKPNLDIPFDKEFFGAHSKIQTLETQLSKALTTQTILQHTYQESEQTRDRQQTRITELEHHTADMQEQILQQAQQASEYETAVQHWKDRYHQGKDYLIRLKELVEQFSQIDSPQTFSALSGELAALLAEIEPITTAPSNTETLSIPQTFTTPRTARDLPDFLARRPRYRVRP